MVYAYVPFAFLSTSVVGGASMLLRIEPSRSIANFQDISRKNLTISKNNHRSSTLQQKHDQ